MTLAVAEALNPDTPTTVIFVFHLMILDQLFSLLLDYKSVVPLFM